MDENNMSNIRNTSMNSKELINGLATNIVDSCIDSCIKIAVEKQINGFYILKYNKTTKKYSSNLIEYSSIIENFHEKKYFLIDILNFSTNHLHNILPVPILNGKYLKENICINNLEHKLIVIFINMKHNNSTSTFSYFMNAINTSNIDFNVFNNTDLHDVEGLNEVETFTSQIQNLLSTTQTYINENPIQNVTLPSPSANIIPNIINSSVNTSLDSHRETYREEIEQMKAMGFTQEYKIIESLIVSDGDVNSAIHYYLQ